MQNERKLPGVEVGAAGSFTGSAPTTALSAHRCKTAYVDIRCIATSVQV